MLRIAKDRGFTLLELITALVIISILALVGIPLFTGIIQKHRIGTAGDNLYFYLQYARTEAIKRNDRIYVSFNTGDTWCYGINTGSTCNCTIANNCNLATVSYSSAQQFSLSLSGITGTSIYFEGTRASANTSGSVTFTQYGLTQPLITVQIGRLGSLSMCATGLNGYTAC